MPEKFTIKRNDLEPDLAVVLLGGDGLPVDLTLATAVKLIMRKGTEVVLEDAMSPALNQTTDRGLITRSWESGDTDTAGTFKAEFEVMWPGNRPQTFPTANYIEVLIVKDLA